MTTSKIKIYELAKELEQDSQSLVETIQRLGIDIKNSMSALGSEEVRTVREYYRKNPALVGTGSVAATPRSGVTEKRVGTNVIRRRAAKPSPEKAPSESAAPTTPVEPLSEDVAEVQAVPSVGTASDVEQASGVVVDAADQRVSVDPPAVESSEQPAGQAEQVTASQAQDTVGGVKKPRRLFPSIIKKVTVEQYLGEKVGPKVERKLRPKPAGTQRTATPASTGQPAQGSSGFGGLRRVKEVEIPQAEAAKEAARRRLSQRQNTVFRSTDFLKRELVHATRKRKGMGSRPALKTQVTQPAEHKRVVEMGETITVGEFAKALGVKATVVVQRLFAMGVVVNINQTIDFDTAMLVAQEFSFDVKQNIFREEDFVSALDLSAEQLEPRPAVVTIMGHVDHGKTTLLDTIRKTRVAAGEAGGITQQIGAYTVDVARGKLTFIDTPGHEAFTGMRQRGAKVTDIVILVVSAVDGVMPQTLESIAHAKAAGVPVVVAINKIDLADANPDRIKQTLSGHDLSPEEWGGDTIYVGVSAKVGTGVDALLEAVLLQAEMLELKANYHTPARGVVIESRLDRHRGPLASVLVQHGKLEPGQIVVSGTLFGRVRAMMDSTGSRVDQALPSFAVELLGLGGVPTVGDQFVVAEDERKARELVEARVAKSQASVSGVREKMSLEQMMAGIAVEKELRVILKADTLGAAQALREAIGQFPSDKVALKILHVAAGGITESDVMLASASGAVILGFNVRPDVKALKEAEHKSIEVRTYTIIYDLLDDVKKMLEGLLDKEIRERVIGRAEVREIFSVPKIGMVAGSAVIDGKVVRGCFLRLLRDSRVIYEGKLSSLRRFKEDVKEVSSGFECGIGLENFNDLKTGDQFEAFLKEEFDSSL